jgi:trimeric autotransporter adhesin
MFKYTQKSAANITHSTAIRQQYINFLARSIICLGLVTVSSSLSLAPLLAASPAPGTKIENKATGSFTDGEDPAAQIEGIESNVVSVTVAEVAGITVSTGTPSEAPAPTNPDPLRPLQGDGTINTGDIAYFDYVITNVGNDPTQFFIPAAPSAVVGGSFDAATYPIQIIAYNPTGSSNNTLASPVSIPTNGGRTGPSTATGVDGLLGKNGIIPAGGNVTIRVPIKVTAVVNSPISVTMGNTPTPLGTNQIYSNNSSLDIYTQDNPDGTTNGTVIETDGIPLNGDGVIGDGDATKHRQESSNIGSTTAIVEPIHITGKVFEDLNYGGGAGRDLTNGIGRPNVRVEIYDASDNYLGATLTDTNGKYKFNSLNIAGFVGSRSYKIRVVNSFVTSSRTGGCTQATSITTPPAACNQIPVQTFRTSGATNNIANPDPNRVGGEDPAKIDADLNSTLALSALTTTTEAVESLTTVGLGLLTITGVDFGYNFDTIVNTKDAGQGSLRQFIINSNELKNDTLAQFGKPAGDEVSIFMIPRGIASPGILAGVPTQLTTGVAIIKVLTQLPDILDANTTIDATTQTTNIGDTNTGNAGAGGNVGTDNRVLSQVNKPEVELNDGTANIPVGLMVRANSTTIRGLSVWGFGNGSQSHEISGNIVTSSYTLNGNQVVCTSADIFTGLLFEKNFIGTNAGGFSATNTNGVGGSNNGKGFFSACGSSGTFQNNLAGFTNGMATYWANFGGNDPNMNWLVENNEIRSAGSNSQTKADNLALENSAHDVTVKGNLIADSYANGISYYKNTANGNVKIDNNTITNSGSGSSSPEWAGIAIFSGSNGGLIISKNIIHDNQGAGIWVAKDFQGVKITQNSMYANGGLGIDLKGITLDNGSGNQTVITDTVTPNDGSTAVSDIANKGMDYPIMTAASISTGGAPTLSIKGYVGNTSAGDTDFANATLEFFVGAADTNDKGRVFSTDPTTVSKLHAEGQTYLGTCTADGNGLFGTTANPCFFTVPAGTDPKKITATTTKDGNTSEFSAPVASDPNVLLVKRITAINGLPQKFGGGSLSGYENSDSAYDDNDITITTQVSPTAPQKDTDKWPTPVSEFLVGAIDGGNVKPKDSIEYTIYFLSTGDSEAKNVLFCDRVPANVTFLANGYNHIPAATTGNSLNRGIVVQIGTVLKAYDSDSTFAQYFAPGVEPRTTYPGISCGKDGNGSQLPNNNGAVVVNLGTIPNADTSSNPPESYGFVRFQGRVK